jgi:two-component system nitrate/nitrite response regulator NarL
MSDKITVGVFDDHPLYREGVVFALEAEPDIVVVGEGESAADAFEIARTCTPNILLLDMNMPGGGLDAVAKIGRQFPESKIMMLTIVDDAEDVRGALKRGAYGYLWKTASSCDLVEALRAVNKGERYVSPEFAAEIFKNRDTKSSVPVTASGCFPELTLREEQVLCLIAQGLNNQDVANELGLTENTIKAYVTPILAKLVVGNRLKASMIYNERIAKGERKSDAI